MTTAPHSTPAMTPGAYAAHLAAWAGTDTERLVAAALAGNGRVLNAFLHRVPDEALPALREALAARPPLPHATTAYGVWEADRELRRRAAVELARQSG